VTLDHFIASLEGLNAELHVEDLLDALWLAQLDRKLTLHETAAPAPGANTVEATLTDGERKGEREATRVTEPDQGERPPAHEPFESAPVYAPGASESDSPKIKASPVAIPAGHALPRRLHFTRAMRPFSQKWPSRRETELDEQRTVEVTADLGMDLYPVFRPVQERWFDVDVVLEDDPAALVWQDTLREFCQMLRDTGGFHDVRRWRLHLDDEQPFLESLPGGGRSSVRVLNGAGVRRLVFFATHGSSVHWNDGVYAGLLGEWRTDSSIVILQLQPRRRWKRSTLGEPQGVALALEPGLPTSALRFEAYWWSLVATEEEGTLVPVPIVPLDPDALSEWAHMQMARGRRCSAVLLDKAPDGAPLNQEPRDASRALKLLLESSPEAYRLAVYLASGPFTLPVARLVQEAMFGAAADQAHLADVLLSGVVAPRRGQESEPDPNRVYYECSQEARTILLHSLHEADAQQIAESLQTYVSRYIEQIHGRAITFQALVPDENGNYELPDWAQPFARLGVSLLGLPTHGKSVRQFVDEILSTPPPSVVGDAIGAVPTGRTPLVLPSSRDADSWQAQALPANLSEFYETLWAQARGDGDATWSGVTLPILATLARTDAPLTVKEIAEKTDVSSTRIRAVLKNLGSYFQRISADEADSSRVGRSPARFKLFHKTFAEFILVKLEIYGGEPLANEVRRARTLTGHKRGVRSVAVLWGGRRALSGAEDETIRLWDLGTGAELRRFDGHQGIVLSVAVLPNEQLALSGSFDRTMRLWNLATGAELRRFEGHSDFVEAVAASPDGRRALSGSGDCTMRLWDLETGVELRVFAGHTATVCSVALLPDGRLALSGAHDGTARLWDLESGTEILRFEGHQAGVNAVATLPDGRRALSGSADKALRLWDLQTGALLRRFEGHTAPVTAVTVLPDGRAALSGSEDGTVRLWEIETGAGLVLLDQGPSGGVGSLGVLPDGTMVLAGLSDGSLRLLEIDNVRRHPERVGDPTAAGRALQPLTVVRVVVRNGDIEFNIIRNDANYLVRHRIAGRASLESFSALLSEEMAPDRLYAHGSLLFHELGAREWWPIAAGNGPLVFVCDGEAAIIPWELMVVPTDGEASVSNGEFLELIRGVTRQFALDRIHPTVDAVERGRDMHLLLVGDTSRDQPLPSTRPEIMRLQELFESFTRSGQRRRVICDVLVGKEDRFEELKERLRSTQYDVLHFSGHCIYGDQQPRLPGLQLAGGRVLSPYEVNGSMPRFVFLNICGHGSPRLAADLAAAFLRSGTRDLICGARPVNDETAMQFAGALYNDLLHRSGFFHDSLLAARRRIWSASGRQAGFGGYQHYGDPYSRPFRELGE
jgi:WD40 repeat protein